MRPISGRESIVRLTGLESADRTQSTLSGRRKFAPLGEGGGAIELEILSAIEVTFLIEVIRD